MRQITRTTARALIAGDNIKSGNTTVINGVMALHGNTIAIYDNVEHLLTLRDSGWRTVTTKERLNGLLATVGSEWRIYQVAGLWLLQNEAGEREPWDGWKVFEV